MPVENPPASSPYSPLLTLKDDGATPKSRLTDARAAQIVVKNLFTAAGKRNEVDASVAGMIDGAPPWDASELKEAGLGWTSNANFGIGEAFLNQALTSYWDVIFNAPTYCTIRLLGKNAEQVDEWSHIVTEEFERFNKADKELSYMFQKSHYDMVLFRHGPVVYFDPLYYKAEAVSQECLFVPNGTPANVNSWPLCVIQQTYTVDKLYQKIRNPDAAAKRGWNVELTQDAIRNAMPKDFQHTTNTWNWVEYEKRLRNNDYAYTAASSEVVVVNWILWREFPSADNEEGAISMGAISDKDPVTDWLFYKVGQYKDWYQAIHPFYYDIGHGDHHSVRGMGQKSFDGLARINILQNRQCDFATVAGSLHWQARDAISKETLSVIPMGPFMVHDAGLNFVNTPSLGGALESTQVIKQDLISTLASNLSTYRPQPMRQRGNPPTAEEVRANVDNSTIVSRTAMLRYFEQLDGFWSERYRRVTNPNLTAGTLGGKECAEFIQRCKDRGVPEDVLRKVEWVRATRTVGWGSPESRRQALGNLMGAIGLYDEDGRRKILKTWTAAQVGTTLAGEFVPDNREPSRNEQEQLKEAQLQVGLAKTGLVPMVTSGQNPAIFASSFLKAAMEAQASVDQGANPQDVFNLVERLGPAIGQHIKRLASDQSRKALTQQLTAAFNEVESKQNQMGKAIAQQLAQARQQQAQMMAKQQAMMNDQAIKQRKAMADESLKAQKQQHKMALDEQKTGQKMATTAAVTSQKIALADKAVAADILRKNAQARAEEKRKQKHEQSASQSGD